MSSRLKLSIGQYSDKGRKDVNQDFYGAYIPTEPQLSTKGVAIALADGISSSQVSQIASEAAVKAFLADYFCTSDAWSVKKSAQQVLTATNSWLHAQSRSSHFRYDLDRGYVCTLSAMVVKSTTAHIFHVGDARIYRVRGRSMEQLTTDHRFQSSQYQSYLSRALGMQLDLEIDYQAVQLEQGEVFLLATDGVYEHVGAQFVAEVTRLHENDLDQAARCIVEEAFKQGSEDNLTAQLVRIDALPEPDAEEAYRQFVTLPFAPALEARMLFDGYRIVREVHASHRSHVYLALDEESGEQAILKIPSVELRQEPVLLERFLMEEWIARRVSSPHVLKPTAQTRKRNFLYVATEYIEGQTLRQWMIDHPRPPLETVRGIVEQIAKGLRAFHRMEMLHQDLRPDNIMIDATGTVKIIDFGSVRVAGVMEMGTATELQPILGTAQYTAPEYFWGENGSPRSDLFSLGVIAYQMLTGTLPYGPQVARIRSTAAQYKLRYDAVRNHAREIPAWVDEAVRKAVHPNPWKRHEALSEFVFDLRHPSREFLQRSRVPLLERNPIAFWRGLALLLAFLVVALLIRLKS